MSRILASGINQITHRYYSGEHDGIDIVKQLNEVDAIVAHSAGTVVMTQVGHINNPGSSGNASYGNLVKIRHANGYYTLYAHLDTVYVENGDTVKKGQAIGYMGNTGNSYGAHLHFELYNRENSRINPTSYIDLDLPNLPTEEVDMTEAEVRALIAAESKKAAEAEIKSYKEELEKMPASSWAEKFWRLATEAEIVDGSMPRAPLTREQYAAILMRIKDAKCPKWAAEAVQWAIDNGLMSGDGKETATPDNVRPRDSVSRAELAVILQRLKTLMDDVEGK